MLAELQQVSKHYGQQASRNQVLRELSLAIGEGESVAIIGPSGSGKSTLLNILGTLDRPSSGKVLIDNQAVAELDDKQLSAIRNLTIGFVFQMHYLLPQLTLIENIFLPVLPEKDRAKRKKAEERGRYLLERVGLKEHLFRRPGELSLGECQRAAVVRALINNPRMLLADEPTGSLDDENAANLGTLLSDVNRTEGVALIVVTHSMELAEKMQKIYRLQGGKLHGITQL
ncbi:MAG: ABC transporter ATP-binding protein [bacterium]